MLQIFFQRYIFFALLGYNLLLFQSVATAQTISIQNNKVSRQLAFDGKVWRTVQFASNDGNPVLKVNSDEFHILGMNDEKFTVKDYEAFGQPQTSREGDTTILIITYGRSLNMNYGENAPAKIIVRYFAIQNEYTIRKSVRLIFDRPAVIDRLEVERFTTASSATGGGRGEPVFLDDRWFTGLEYPAGYSRHTNGNTPAAYSRYYEMVGNYSYIDLEGRDIEQNAQPGMVRLMHFPGNTVNGKNGSYIIESKTAVTGTGKRGETAAVAFMQYLSGIWKKPKSFLHYNNWFEPKAKDLKGDALLEIFKDFQEAIGPYHIKMDAMVADDGWQDHQSIWQPSPRYFPEGITDMKRLSEKLRQAGAGFGLWLSIGGTNAGVDWGASHGYLPAKPNKYFSQYFKYYSLSHPKYKSEMLRQVPALAQGADLVYYKHDFNQLSDLTDAGHPPTDRHGHEANLDAMIEILTETRKVKPEIYQNITNWIWFSPWWLMYGDALWMLAGDDGMNGNWPEISSRAMATTDRDTYIWRMWGNAADRPLVPISRLMTHGLIRNSTGNMESSEDTMQDWLEHVLMHYGRGTLLKEWYISPEVMNPDHWKALCSVHNWAKANQDKLNNMVFVGGRPDEGNPYGYIGWSGNKAVLVARNPSATTKKLLVPFNASVYFKGKAGDYYKARVVFPYLDNYARQFTSGQQMEIELPGYATMAFEVEPGRSQKTIAIPQAPSVDNSTANISSVHIPRDAGIRCDLLLVGYDSIPPIKVNGEALKPVRMSKSAINKFAGYAKAGMISEKARNWKMTVYDLRKFAGLAVKIECTPPEGTSVELHLLMERSVGEKADKNDQTRPWAITNTTRRQTIQLR